MATYEQNLATLKVCQAAYDHMSPPEYPEDEEQDNDDWPDPPAGRRRDD